jgi:hypothetical protein
VKIVMITQVTDWPASHESVSPGIFQLREWGMEQRYALPNVSKPGANIQLIVCESRADTAFPLSTPIEVPSLATRAGDLPRIIAEYAEDAIAALGAPAGSFEPHHHRWVLEHAAASLAEIEKATSRRLALRSSANLSRATAALGMAPVSLSRWLDRRWSPPMRPPDRRGHR